MTHVSELVPESTLNELPSTLVLRLLLGPLDFSIRVSRQGLRNRSEGEWRDLLDSDDGNIVDASLGSFGIQVVEDLSRAENDLFNLVIGSHICAVFINGSLESETLSKVFDVRVGSLELQEFLGCDDNQRLSEWSSHLGSKQVEVVGGGRAVSNSHVVGLLDHTLAHIFRGRHVVGIGESQVSLDSAGGVLGALSIITMGEEHNETVLDIPLLLTGSDELVDHDLGSIGEVTELGFPNAESSGTCLGISVLETEDSELRKM